MWGCAVNIVVRGAYVWPGCAFRMAATRPVRTLGIGISVLGLVLAITSLVALTSLKCAFQGGCQTVFHWPTLGTGLGLVFLGLGLVATQFLADHRRRA